MAGEAAHHRGKLGNRSEQWAFGTRWSTDLPDSRERVLSDAQIFEGQKVIVGSNVPKLGGTGETCDFGLLAEGNFINVFNMLTGAPAQSPVFATGDSSMNLANATRTRFGSGEYIGINKPPGGLKLISFVNDDDGGVKLPGELTTDNLDLNASDALGARADWREIR